MHAKNNLMAKHLRRLIYNGVRLVSARKPVGTGVILNSLPKSGTHLVHLILKELGYIDYEGFYASTSPATMRVKSAQSAITAFSQVLDGEVFCSHAFFHSRIEGALEDEGLCPMVFVSRDPRAVFVSELHYLTELNRVHRYSRYLARLPSPEAKFRALLYGDPNAPFFFPDFAQRVEAYAGWLDCQKVLQLKFETLVSDAKSTQISEIVDFLSLTRRESLSPSKRDQIVESVVRNLEPRASHTYTGLPPNRWKSQLTTDERAELENTLGPLIEKFGYE